jgi:glycosyltransferase involved in cell wall biosynthesis
MKGRAQFRMVGNHRLPPKVVGRLAEAVELAGIVPRAEMPKQLAWADVFLLPSLCEGSATAVYEAMAAGLPVVCTPNTGSVVRDGIDGYVVPIRDVGAIAGALDRLAADRGLRDRLAANARRRMTDFDLAAYRDRMLDCLIPPGG